VIVYVACSAVVTLTAVTDDDGNEVKHVNQTLYTDQGRMFVKFSEYNNYFDFACAPVVMCVLFYDLSIV